MGSNVMLLDVNTIAFSYKLVGEPELWGVYSFQQLSEITEHSAIAPRLSPTGSVGDWSTASRGKPAQTWKVLWPNAPAINHIER